MANELCYFPSSSYDYYYDLPGDDIFNLTGFCGFGYVKDDEYVGSGSIGGALRFANIAVDRNTSVIEAYIRFRIGYVTGNDANVYFKVWGIDEDNTGNFGSNPMGRTKTTAYKQEWWGSPSSGSWGNIDVTDIVNEILSRGGWNNGNAMGFLINDNGTAHDQSRYVLDMYDGEDAYLVIRLVAQPNMKPTPVTVAAPTFPAADSWGIKVSKPGANVLTCPEADLFYTSRKKVFRVLHEAAATPSGGLVTYNHNLGYQPAFLAYADNGGYKYRLPTAWSLSGGGYVSSNTTQVKITTSGGSVYYYVFIDPLQS